MKRIQVVALLVMIALVTVGAQAAIIVETHESGKAFENFEGTPRYSVTPSTAIGTIATSTAYGSTVVSDPDIDVYVFSYAPVTDLDNTTIAAGTDLGNGDLASGLVGSAVGFYNVYTTWPASTSVTGGPAIFTVTYDGGTVVTSWDQNTGMSGGTNAWLLIAEGVFLSVGNAYTVTQVSTTGSWTSMRSGGVMWELVEAAPEMATIIESDGTTDVTEGGATDTYTIALKEQPLIDTVVTVEALDPNQLLLNGQIDTKLELTFTPENYENGQEVTVEAFDDTAIEGDHSVMVLHWVLAADPNDNGYGGLVTVNIIDNEGPGMRIIESDGTTEVSEDGPTSDDYMVRLLYPPTDDVTVIIETDGQVLVDTGSGLGTTAELVFTSGDWHDDQPVTVTAVDDDVLEYAHTSQITHVASSLDGGYDGFEGPNVVVSIDDNECGAWGYLELDLNEDCVVDINDFIEFVAVWMECTQPYGDSCTDLR